MEQLLVQVSPWRHSFYAMIDYNQRSDKKELLDQENIPFADIQRNMEELQFINSWLGGHSITIDGFKDIAGSKKTLFVCEIGCGGGDNLNTIYKWSERKGKDILVTGIDINENCILYATKRTLLPGTTFIVSDYRNYQFSNSKPDIIFSSLFCHHFSSAELVEMIKWMNANSSLGFFINDLHRHPVAYHFITFATSLFSKSYLVKNDAPLSVLRGFKMKEWIEIFSKAGIKNYKIKWKWAFRYLIVVKK